MNMISARYLFARSSSGGDVATLHFLLYTWIVNSVHLINFHKSMDTVESNNTNFPHACSLQTRAPASQQLSARYRSLWSTSCWTSLHFSIDPLGEKRVSISGSSFYGNDETESYLRQEQAGHAALQSQWTSIGTCVTGPLRKWKRFYRRSRKTVLLKTLTHR